MDELHSLESFNAMRGAEFAVIVFAPRWSKYALQAEAAFRSIVPDLESAGIHVFVAIEDDPRANPQLAEWFEVNRTRLNGIVGLGSGELVLLRKGTPVHTRQTLHAARMTEVRDRLMAQVQETPTSE